MSAGLMPSTVAQAAALSGLFARNATILAGSQDATLSVPPYKPDVPPLTVPPVAPGGTAVSGWVVTDGMNGLTPSDGPGSVTATAESDGVISWVATTAPASTRTV